MSERSKHRKNCTCSKCIVDFDVSLETPKHSKKGPKGHSEKEYDQCHEKCHKPHKCCTGPTGPAGSSNVGGIFPSIIPYSSGRDPVTLSLGNDIIIFEEGYVSSIGAMIAFGDSLQNVILTSGMIDFSNNRGLRANFAFVVPRDGMIKSLFISFQSSAITNIVLNNQVNNQLNNQADNQLNENNNSYSLKPPRVAIRGQVYKAPPRASKASAIGKVALAPILQPSTLNSTLEPNNLNDCIVKTINIGDIIEGQAKDINVNVNEGDKLILFFNLVSDGTVNNISLTGYLSAGLSIL